MLEAVKAGASIINDVRALRLPGALEAAAKAGVPVCLMHMRYLTQAEIQNTVSTANLMQVIHDFLVERIEVCLKAGILKHNIIIDPGIGAGRFGKSLAENLLILHHLQILKKLNYPLLVGVSRKLFIGELLSASPEERLFASIAAATLAVYNGANIIRTHDVKPTIDAVKLAAATLEVV
jgi:dihydropteroate synthase